MSGDWGLGGLGTGDYGELPSTGYVSEPGGGGSVKSYEDLRVWRLGVDLTEAVYRATGGVPDHEQFGLTSQLRRAAVSVPSNIAEGWGRGSRADYRRFVLQARGSLYEVETQLAIARRLDYLNDRIADALRTDTQALSRQLHALVRALDSPSPQSP